MARVEVNVYDIFSLNHAKITTATNPSQFFDTISKEMKIKNVDTAYNDRGQELDHSQIRDLVNDQSVWIRSKSDRRHVNPNTILHLVVLGPPEVGKSAVTFRFSYDNFIPEHEPTVEDFWSKQSIVDGEALHLEILDTAGLEEFNNLDFGTWVGKKDGIILVYCINKRTTWTDIRDKHYKSCEEELDGKLPPTIVIGNKKDLENQRTVQKSEVQLKCDEWGDVMFVETSAKTDEQVVESFVKLIRQILVEKKLYKKKKNSGFCTLL